MAEKRHWKLYIDGDLVDRYERCAGKYGRRSGNEVAAEVLERYLDFWEEIEQARQQVFEDAFTQQRQKLGVSQPYTSGRGSKGEAERVRKDAQAREQKKKRGNE